MSTEAVAAAPASAESTPAAEPAPALSEEEALAAKRKEVEEKVAALKLQRKKEEEQRTNFFGEHPGITCDGCGTRPIVGYRYHCKSCPNHDVCESCYDAWKGGSGTMANGANMQVISKDPTAHTFGLHKDKTFKPLVKAPAGAEKSGGGKGPKQPKPNDPCTCGSGKKFKKCCGK